MPNAPNTREVCALSAPKAHDEAELLFGALKAPVIYSHFVKYAKQPHLVKYVESQARSDCYEVTVAATVSQYC